MLGLQWESLLTCSTNPYQYITITHLHHSPTPLTRTTHLHEGLCRAGGRVVKLIGLTFTTHLHHSPSPLTCTTHLHHSPAPLTRTTHLHHSPALEVVRGREPGS